MSSIVRYSSGSTYTLVKQKVDTEIIQDVTTYHVPLTNINGGVRGGLGLSRITIAGQIEDRTACLWHDIVAVSLDSGTSYQTVYFSSVSCSEDGWSGIYPFTLELIASPLKEQAAVRYPTSTSAWYWGLSHIDNVSQAGNAGAPIELHYLAPLYYFPLQQSIQDFAGRGLTFTRALAKVHAGVSYAINAPIHDNGLYIGADTSQDTPKLTLGNDTTQTIVCELKSTRYPSEWIVGAGVAANLLTANQSDAETATTGMTSAGGTFTRSASAGDFYAGVGGFKNVSTGSNNVVIQTTTTPAAVTAGKFYAGAAYVKATAAAGRHWKIGIAWYTAADALISTSESAESDASAVWTRIDVRGEAPATATKAYVILTLVSGLNAEILNADCLMLEEIAEANIIVWTDGSKNKLWIDIANDLLKWTDFTDTVSCAFPTAHFLVDKDTVTVVVIHNGNTKDVHCREAGGAWTDGTGTLAALIWTSEMTLGNLNGSIASLTQYPYALVLAEYGALNFSLVPLGFNTLYIANNQAEEIVKGSDGTLETASGIDVSGSLAGTDVTVTSTPATVTMSQGLAARWYLNVKRTDV
jgi:hypothetical protein